MDGWAAAGVPPASLLIQDGLHHNDRGYACLADVPAIQVGGQSANLLHYRRAVHAALQADLVQTWRGMAAIATGNKLERNSDDLQQTAGDYLRQLRNAIADIRGNARCTVELL